MKFRGRELGFVLRSDADRSVYDEIFTEREYQVLEPCIGAAQHLVLDLGAHVGFFSAYARALNAQVPIVAYEADAENYAQLKVHVKENHLNAVVAKNAAVTGRTGDVLLYRSSDSHTHSLYGEGSGVRVPGTTLAQIFERYAPGGCDVVKMDIEGAEYEVLLGAPAEVFRKTRVWYIEYHEYLPEMRGSALKQLFLRYYADVRCVPSRHDSRMGLLMAQKPVL